MSRTQTKSREKYKLVIREDGRHDVRLASPRTSKGGFRSLDPNSKTDVPFKGIMDEDSARLAMAQLNQQGYIGERI